MFHRPHMLQKNGDDLFDHYRHMLDKISPPKPISAIKHPLAVTIQRLAKRCLYGNAQASSWLSIFLYLLTYLL